MFFYYIFLDFMFFLSCVCYAFVRVCLYVPCGHLLGKGWPLGSRLWCPTVSLSLSHWYSGSGVVLDCIDSWSLHPYLLWQEIGLEICHHIIQMEYLILLSIRIQKCHLLQISGGPFKFNMQWNMHYIKDLIWVLMFYWIY